MGKLPGNCSISVKSGQQVHGVSRSESCWREILPHQKDILRDAGDQALVYGCFRLHPLHFCQVAGSKTTSHHAEDDQKLCSVCSVCHGLVTALAYIPDRVTNHVLLSVLQDRFAMTHAKAHV